MQYLYRLDNETTWKSISASSLAQAAEHAALREVGPSAMAFVLRIWVRGERRTLTDRPRKEPQTLALRWVRLRK